MTPSGPAAERMRAADGRAHLGVRSLRSGLANSGCIITPGRFERVKQLRQAAYGAVRRGIRATAALTRTRARQGTISLSARTLAGSGYCKASMPRPVGICIQLAST